MNFTFLTLPPLIQLFDNEALSWGLIACGIVVSVLPTLILALFIQKYLVQGLSLGAVKG